jgi:hypothetical protein
LLDETRDLLFRFIVKQASVVRVCAHCRVNILVFLSQLDCAFQCAAMRIASADIQNCGNAGIAGTLNSLLAICVKLRTVYVRMRIDEHLRQRIREKGKDKNQNREQ